MNTKKAEIRKLSARKQNFQQAKLLIIDDNSDQMEQSLKQCLPEVEPVIKRSENEVVDYLNTCLIRDWKLPKLILLDIYLPKRDDGLRMIERIKDLPAPINQIPVVVLSYSNLPEDIRCAYDRGSSSYLLKPVATDEWLSRFKMLRMYWWETVSLPHTSYRL